MNPRGTCQLYINVEIKCARALTKPFSRTRKSKARAKSPVPAAREGGKKEGREGERKGGGRVGGREAGREAKRYFLVSSWAHNAQVLSLHIYIIPVCVCVCVHHNFLQSAI